MSGRNKPPNNALQASVGAVAAAAYCATAAQAPPSPERERSADMKAQED